MRMLVIAAHPDDEVLGCGGYMVKFSRQGEVFTAVVTEGCSTQYREDDVEGLIRKKQADCALANKILGAREVIFGRFPDMKLESAGHTKLNAFLEELIDEIKPDFILTHHFGDVNLDHRCVCSSVLVAARPLGKKPCNLLLFETPSATEWGGVDLRSVFTPNYYVDIKDSLTRKIEALQCYGMELRKFPHPRSEEGVRAYASFRGLACGLEAAEAYSACRLIC